MAAATAPGTPLAAIGVKLGYQAKGSSTTIPTTGYTRIYDMKTTGDLNSSPNTADASTFDNTVYTTYVNLLKDLGGALEFSANLTDGFLDTWEACVTAASTSGCYFVIDVGLDKAVGFLGMPSPLGMPSLTANTLMECSVYITPLGEPSWVTLGNTPFGS